MKKICSLLILALFCNPLLAQKQALHWNFGAFAGFDFSLNCQPTAVADSKIDTHEGTASISDSVTGQLLFYSDAIEVWNRENEPMPNSGDGDPTPGINRGFSPLSQGALIVPSPDRPSIYYLFSLIDTDPENTSYNPPGKLSYSRIDMRLDAGKGDVIVADKHTFIADGLLGRLTAVRHANGKDYWLITHQSGTNAFLVFPITAAGIGEADTIRIGTVSDAKYGYLRASPDGRKLACSSRTLTAHPFDLFDFNPATGIISNYVNLGNIRVGYGISFSPDNSKLYVSNMTIAGKDGPNVDTEVIRQYDLSAGDVNAVIASGQSIIYGNNTLNFNQRDYVISDFYAPALQLGPDGKLYAASNANALLCTNCGYRFFVINKPNEPGFAADIKLQAAELAGGVAGNATDFPNFMQHYFNGLESRECYFDDNELCSEENILLWPNPSNKMLQIVITDICFTPYTLSIINVSGQALGEHEVALPRSQTIDIGLLSAGMYLAKLRFKDRTIVKRFVKY
ncbi:T9SS type A sorting domain-containing protein [Dyadobacter sp. CY261]|uniref:T9SS type A sorting domain-containing protein n=1 Tax=Dyadobacter sp. CY261 TaxID=2907203 RepID=UPI001F205701|nr:T9SS type A sorting domain-containing protein [Dyadobacter sp. CY261]MCF0069565.1 T9SS type A sorting domain-containing protein [Dyadobacter sp. CY261]